MNRPTSPWWRRPSRDLVASASGAATFSVALGIAAVAFPLMAVDAGYSNSMVGLLTAISAVGQITTRLFLAAAMRRFSDWLLVLAAGALLCVSSGVVAFSTALLPFIVAQILQGSARACFWTGSQTHVVRGQGAARSSLALIGFTAGVGMTAGPAIAGVVGERSLAMALVLSAFFAVLGMVPTLLLDRHPPFAARGKRSGGRMWRRPGVEIGCWAGVGSGAWRGLLHSYVPVALIEAGQASTRIGALIAAANVASMVGTVIVARVRGSWLRVSYAVSTLLAGAGIGLCGYLAGSFLLVGVFLVLSGLGSGVLQTLSAGIAAESVSEQERGDAITAVGTFRAVALFASPLGVGALLVVIPLSAAMGVLGALMTLPALARRFADEDPPPEVT